MGQERLGDDKILTHYMHSQSEGFRLFVMHYIIKPNSKTQSYMKMNSLKHFIGCPVRSQMRSKNLSYI